MESWPPPGEFCQYVTGTAQKDQGRSSLGPVQGTLFLELDGDVPRSQARVSLGPIQGTLFLEPHEDGPKDQARVSLGVVGGTLFLVTHSASIFCIGVVALVVYATKRHTTRATLVGIVGSITLVVILIDSFWEGMPEDNALLHLVASTVASVVAYAALAWFLRHDDIKTAMVFLLYSCLQVPVWTTSEASLEFNYAVLLTTKVAAIGAMYASFDVLQNRERQRHDESRAKGEK